MEISLYSTTLSPQSISRLYISLLSSPASLTLKSNVIFLSVESTRMLWACINSEPYIYSVPGWGNVMVVVKVSWASSLSDGYNVNVSVCWPYCWNSSKSKIISWFSLTFSLRSSWLLEPSLYSIFKS